VVGFQDASGRRGITALLGGKPDVARRLLIEITETAARFVGALRQLRPARSRRFLRR
jgi:hypothetical protein